MTLMVNHLIGFGGGRSVVQTLIDASGATKIGTMTANGGLAAAFDGVTAQADAAACLTVGNSTAGYNNTAGVDWGAGNSKIITRVDWYATSDTALLGGGGGSTFKLQGSHDNSAWDDLITTGTILATAGSSSLNNIPIATTAYRYHRSNFSGNGANAGRIAEVRLYEDI